MDRMVSSTDRAPSTVAGSAVEAVARRDRLVVTAGLAVLTALGWTYLLVLAGVYQLTPLKRACLDHCRSPVHFLTGHWRPGGAGAFRMGLAHGAFCVGCCWVLMALLFVGGVMNLLWIAALAGFVLLEKVLPHGSLVGRAIGAMLIAAGVWMLAGTGTAGTWRPRKTSRRIPQMPGGLRRRSSGKRPPDLPQDHIADGGGSALR